MWEKETPTHVYVPASSKKYNSFQMETSLLWTVIHQTYEKPSWAVSRLNHSHNFIQLPCCWARQLQLDELAPRDGEKDPTNKLLAKGQYSWSSPSSGCGLRPTPGKEAVSQAVKWVQAWNKTCSEKIGFCLYDCFNWYPLWKSFQYILMKIDFFKWC